MHLTQSHSTIMNCLSDNLKSFRVYFHELSFWIVMLTLYYKPGINITMNIILTNFHIRFSLQWNFQIVYTIVTSVCYREESLSYWLELNIYKYMYICIDNLFTDHIYNYIMNFLFPSNNNIYLKYF